MSLTFSKDELYNLMYNFHTLTGIRIVLFDDNFKEIFAYPEDCVPFCARMREIPEFYDMCCKSDKHSFDICQKTHSFHMYKCHAGLIECTAPIIDNSSIIGYIMFGQVSDAKDKSTIKYDLAQVCKNYNCSDNMLKEIDKIRSKRTKQLTAASKILEACVSFILSSEMVKPSRIQLFNLIDEHISSHLNEDLSVESLCHTFNLSRTKLYSTMKPYLTGGIASYIKQKRFLKAKELLKTTDMSVFDISVAVGFSDYNYFLRSFKKYYGTPTKSIRDKGLKTS